VTQNFSDLLLLLSDKIYFPSRKSFRLKIKKIPRGAIMPRHKTLIVADLNFEAFTGKV